MLSPGFRFAGVYFPANGKFYAMGGRDIANFEFTNPFEYDPGSNSWITKSAAYPDSHVSNIACAVLNDNGRDYIYCVGGSEFGTATTTARVFRYDPIADSIRAIPSGWPPGHQNILPGGFSVFNNKLYILGGYNINVGMDDGIWEFTPSPAGWVQKTAVLPVPLGYIPQCTIGNFIYTGGGSMFDPSVILVPTTNSFKYDPTADSITTIANIPRPTDNTRGLKFGNQLWVIGGDDTTSPNPSNEVDVYDPVSNTWSLGQPMNTARSNFATDTDGTNSIWVAGGYNSTIGTTDSMEIFNCTSTCLPPASGLVSWWAGDGTADDVQGTNPGRLLNGTSFTRGMVGPGFLFDGIDDAVVIPNSASLSPIQLTLDAWIYATGRAGAGRHIVSKDNEEAGTRQYILAIAQPSGQALTADVTDEFAAFVQLPTGEELLFGTTTVQLNTWYHVAMTHDGATLRLYVNGVLEATTPAAGTIVPTDNPVGIGQNTHGLGGSLAFQGIIDEAQIFDRALTDAEIMAIYQAGAAGECKPDIFVGSITPSYEVVGQGFLISTSIVIQDENGNSIEGASLQVKTMLPSGSVLAFSATTDATGQATISFATQDSGLYKFKVQRVTDPTREYNASLNIETSDRLLIP